MAATASTAANPIPTNPSDEYFVVRSLGSSNLLDQAEIFQGSDSPAYSG